MDDITLQASSHGPCRIDDFDVLAIKYRALFVESDNRFTKDDVNLLDALYRDPDPAVLRTAAGGVKDDEQVRDRLRNIKNQAQRLAPELRGLSLNATLYAVMGILKSQFVEEDGEWTVQQSTKFWPKASDMRERRPRGYSGGASQSSGQG